MQNGFRTRSERLRLHTTVQVWDGAATRPALLTNLSEGGAFLAVAPPIPIDRGVSFWLELEGQRFNLRGHVRWTRSLPAGSLHPIGSGLQFYDPDRKLAHALRKAIHRSLREGACSGAGRGLQSPWESGPSGS